MRFPGCLLWSVWLFMTAPSAAEVYRCTGEFGEVMYSQLPCDAAITIAVPFAESASAFPSGEGLRASELAWLRARAQGRSASRRPARETGTLRETTKARQAYQCQRKRAGLDAVRTKMRRGYKPAQGEKLRRRRRAYEDYLEAFCPG